MKRMTSLIVTVVIALLVAPGSSLAADAHGVLKVVKGDVKVKSGKTGKTSPAKVGMKVLAEDSIITAKASRAKVVMSDKNVINISPETNIRIDKYEFDPKKGKKNVLLNVLSGKIRNKVNQKYDGKKNKFQVKTPSAVAGVRGTDFLTGFNPSNSETQVVTFEGEVSFGLPGANGEIKNPVPVKVGQFTTSQGGQPPAPPSVMPKTELAKLDQESNADTAAGPEDSGPRAPASDAGEAEKEEQEGGEPKKGPGEGKKQPGAEDKEAGGPENEPKGRARGARPEDERGVGEGRGPEDGRDPASTAEGPAPGPEGGEPGMESEPIAGAPAPDGDGTMPPPPGDDGMAPPPPEAGCDMCVEGDFPVSEEPIFTPLPDDTAMLPPPLPDYNYVPDCGDFCREVIESGSTNLIINITQ